MPNLTNMYSKEMPTNNSLNIKDYLFLSIWFFYLKIKCYGLILIISVFNH
jgi:hypothetical protein